MRDKCDGCPCLESKDNRPFCYWYQGWADAKNGCGNSFEEKPKHTQEEIEEITAEQFDKDVQKFVDNDPTLDPQMREYIQWDVDHLPGFKEEVEKLKTKKEKNEALKARILVKQKGNK